MRQQALLIVAPLALLGLVLAAAPPAAGAGSEPTAGSGTDPYGSVRNVLPPGQAGTITATGLARVVAGDPVNRVAVDGENAPPHVADQLEAYDALGHADPASVTEATLPRYYKDAPLTLSDADTVRRLDPRDGVVIRYDDHGVPYVTGRTREDVAFGAGYAGTRDRMFLADVLRHAGAARSAEFLGATEDNVAMDRAQLRTAYHTPEEAEAQVADLPERFGPLGERLVAAVDAYVDGINAAQADMCPGLLPVGVGCPAEYAALQRKPEPWTRADVVYVASLVGGIFGKGGGAEATNASWLQALTDRFGDEEGRAAYEDLRAEDDPESPTTATTRTPYEVAPVDPDRPGVALPDQDGPSAPGTGADADGSSLPGLPGLPPLGGLGTSQAGETSLRLDLPKGSLDLGALGLGMSNAALVSGDRTADGHPVTVFGPQTGYYTPQLLTEQALVGPGVRARGVSFAGTNLVVQLGRGVDYAWSATSAGSDNVDTVAERLCEPDGSAPTVESTHYRVGNACLPFDSHVHSYTAVPTLASGPGLPRTYRYQVLRTRHGIVQERRTVAGEPVALVLQRSTYAHEVDSAVGFMLLGDPGHTSDAASFASAAARIDYTFNWFYADDRDISYYSSGLLPVRAEGTDADLPRWGDAAYDWAGWLPDDAHPQQTDPPTGALVSWNNRPAPGFGAADDQWGYNAVHRSLALSDRVQALADAGDVSRVDLVRAVQDAATVDSRARYTLPALLDVLGDGGGDPRTAEATALLRAWLDDGAHRLDADRDGAYAHEAAIALFDEWWESAAASGTGDESVARDVLRGRLGGLVDRLPQALDDHPRQGTGSSWLGSPWYGYVNEDLRAVSGEDVPGWSQPSCGGGSLEACRDTLRDSLAAAVDRATAAQGVEGAGDLTYDKTLESIRHVTAGLVGVRPIDWQNRPTFQQVVRFTGHRDRPDGAHVP